METDGRNNSEDTIHHTDKLTTTVQVSTSHLASFLVFFSFSAIRLKIYAGLEKYKGKNKIAKETKRI